MVSEFKVTRVWTIDGQQHAEQKGKDGFVSYHRLSSDNLIVGETFTLSRNSEIDRIAAEVKSEIEAEEKHSA